MAHQPARPHRAVRGLFQLGRRLASRLRILAIRLQYPAASIDGATHVSRGCDIACADDSRLVLRGVYVSQGTTLRANTGGELVMESGFLGPNCVVVATESIHIGAGCSIAEGVVIRDHDHVTGQGSLTTSGLHRAPIAIGANVWLGAKATVLRGSDVGDDAVIAAHALVRQQAVEPGATYVGAPARRVR